MHSVVVLFYEHYVCINKLTFNNFIVKQTENFVDNPTLLNFEGMCGQFALSY